MKTFRTSLIVVTGLLLTTVGLGNSIVDITGNFVEGNQIIIPLIYEGSGVSSLQLECSYLPEEMKLDRVIPGEIVSGSDKEMIKKIAEEVDFDLIKLLFTGFNQTEIGEGPLAYLVFTRINSEVAGRVSPRSITAADKFAQPVSANWRDRQALDKSRIRDGGYLMSFSQATDNSCRVYYQGYYFEPVDLYLKKVYEEDGFKNWEYFLIEKNVRGDISGSYDVKSDEYKGRMMIQVFSADADVDWEQEIVESQDVFFKKTSAPEILKKRRDSSFDRFSDSVDK